ncbi:hypothetical protein [Nocardia sp. alder85J]|uniref:hypothetical protein n=1 Tax=Nocardia sp. alder85J TaxID=2862949 RepID=UPI001CD27AAB|nr:hypothetical protein [Nocardia sp. alder85J]MCX4093576.1 hypothetical protein [Nocardia sp. alder85J]
MVIVIVLIAGIALGALTVSVLNRTTGSRRRADAARHPARSQPEDTPASRDLNEHAGGSRHIRTHPSWRDRLE